MTTDPQTLTTDELADLRKWVGPKPVLGVSAEAGAVTTCRRLLDVVDAKEAENEALRAILKKVAGSVTWWARLDRREADMGQWWTDEERDLIRQAGIGKKP